LPNVKDFFYSTAIAISFSLLYFLLYFINYDSRFLIYKFDTLTVQKMLKMLKKTYRKHSHHAV